MAGASVKGSRFEVQGSRFKVQPDDVVCDRSIGAKQNRKCLDF